jgi:TetR/AcrR family transcriptional regulator, cholesterol catabolism regulator
LPAKTAKQKRKKRTPRTDGRVEELRIVAARLFRDQGYDATSMQDIADEMGILKGSVYHYVRTKEDLLWMVVEAPLRDLVKDVEKILTDDSIPLGDRMTKAMEQHARSFEVDYPYMFVIVGETGDALAPARRRAFAELQARYTTIWEHALQAGVKDGTLRADLEVRIVCQAIFGMINWMFRWFKPGQSLSATEVASTFSTILLQGISTDSAG